MTVFLTWVDFDRLPRRCMRDVGNQVPMRALFAALAVVPCASVCHVRCDGLKSSLRRGGMRLMVGPICPCADIIPLLSASWCDMSAPLGSNGTFSGGNPFLAAIPLVRDRYVSSLVMLEGGGVHANQEPIPMPRSVSIVRPNVVFRPARTSSAQRCTAASILFLTTSHSS